MMRKRAFSGIQPTGDPHLGNYLGALRGWAARQEEHESFYCIVDLHSMTLPWDPKELDGKSLEVTASLLAAGLDPAKVVLFRQSHVSQHTELTWILTCIARMGELGRMIQYKEKSRGTGAESTGVGLFTYPVLQAADVLLYQADGVPVGADQRQHIELMRDLAIRFNGQFGDTFTVPEAWIPEAGARIMALDDPTQKMSKSSQRPNSVVNLTDEPALVLKKFKSAVTDSGSEVVAREDKPALTNLLTIFSLVSDTPVRALEERFSGSGYGDFKKALGEAVVEGLSPIRERYLELMDDPGGLARILAQGAARAEAVAEATMVRVWDVVGLGARPDFRSRRAPTE